MKYLLLYLKMKMFVMEMKIAKSRYISTFFYDIIFVGDDMKKLFGELNLTWPKIFISAIIMGIYTALMALIPQVRYTSFNTISVTFEVWILIGILIIMNSKSNKEAALKCFVFFLISQPLVYLIQVPFSWQGWGLFKYYKYWFAWTILTIPMGYVGYYMKRDKWWGLLILMPMIFLTIYEYNIYLSDFLFSYPYYILIVLFCIVMPYVYIFNIFSSKKVRIVGSVISTLLIIVSTVLCLMSSYTYKTSFISSVNGKDINEDYKVSLKDSKYGDVKIVYSESLEGYIVEAEFKRPGKTKFIIETPEGEKIEYNLEIFKDKYILEEK